MNTKKWVGLVAALVLPLLTGQAQAPAGAPDTSTVPAVSPTAAEVVKMAEAGTSDEVLLAYIRNSTSSFDLTADQILYLRDIGLSSPVITAMLTRDSDLRSQAPAPAPAAPIAPAAVQPPPPEQAPPPAAVEAPLTPPAAYVSSPPAEVNYFYDSLTPYGSWVDLEGVGWCWQPRVVVINHGWRPYCDSGHWVFTDAGWFWASDYSWGWAPFHYGRWYLHDRCGWVWTPDRVWGPAWVTWRSEGDHCGWAPLPPRAVFDVGFGWRFNGVHVGLDFDFGLRPDHFTFIALRDFHDHDFAHHRLPPTQVTQIYNHTTIINNYTVNNNTVVNQGIKVDRVAAATHTEIKKVAIRDAPAWSPAAPSARVSPKGELTVYRPQLKAPARPVNMVAQKVDERHPVIQHQAVIPVKTERPLVGGSTPGGANRSAQATVGSPRTAVERTPASPQTQRPLNAPRAANAPSSSTAVPNRPESAKAVTAPLTPPSTARQQERSESVPRAQPRANPQPSYPLRSGTSADTYRGNPQPQNQNPHTYYPKGYYQAPESRALPPANNARPSDSRPQPSYNTQPGGQPNSGSRDRGQGQSRKNDQ